MKKLAYPLLALLLCTSCLLNSPHEYTIAEADELHNDGEYGKAVAMYTTLLEDNGSFDSIVQKAGVYLNRGNSLVQLKDYESAIEDYNSAIKLVPDTAEAYANRGIAFDTMGKYENAIDNYKQALKLKPDLGEPPGIFSRILWNIQEVPSTILDRLKFLEKMHEDENKNKAGGRPASPE